MVIRQRIAAPLILFALVTAAHAQIETRRASIRGSSGDRGKCTIEVEVDGVAEVEVSVDMGRIRTLEGQPSTWRRFECSGALPRNPFEFRFRGIDGRGRVELIREPQNTRGSAVVRIEDPKGGREGYTFDLEWRGTTGSYPGDRYPSDRYPGGDRSGGGRYSAEEAVRICRDAVRDRAARDYDARNINFNSIAADNNRNRRDWIVGTFTANRRGSREDFSFACSVDFSSGLVRQVDISALGRR